MRTVSASKARANLDCLLDRASRDDEPVLIKGKYTNAVLLSENAWRGIEETLYLVSIPGLKESILEGAAAPVEKCANQLEW